MRKLIILSLGALLSSCGATDSNMKHQHAHDHGEKHAHSEHHHRFENPEDFLDRWNSPERDEWQQPEVVIELLEVSPGADVADLGAGTGYFVPHLSKAVGQSGKVFALDAEPNMVAYIDKSAKNKGLENVVAQAVPFDSTGFEAASFDRILTVNTWHHFENRVEYARHLKKVLKPNGFMMVVDFTAEAEQGPPPAMRLAPEVVIAELEAAGFQAELSETKLPRQYIIIARP